MLFSKKVILIQKISGVLKELRTGEIPGTFCQVISILGCAELDRSSRVALQNMDVSGNSFGRAGDVDVLIHICLTELRRKRGTIRITVFLQTCNKSHESDQLFFADRHTVVLVLTS